MTIHVPEALERRIRDHGASTYNEEACGLLIGTEDRSAGDGPHQVEVEVYDLRMMDNTKDTERERRYIIDPMALMKAEDELEGGAYQIVGIYHSHPDHPARPSQFDQDHALPGLSYIILSVTKGEPKDITSWRLSDDRKTFHPEPLVLSRATSARFNNR